MKQNKNKVFYVENRKVWEVETKREQCGCVSGEDGVDTKKKDWTCHIAKSQISITLVAPS